MKHLPCNQTPWGQLVAVNVHTGDVAWRTTLGITESFPAGQQETGRPGLGGTTVTASGLTFVGPPTTGGSGHLTPPPVRIYGP